MIIPALVKLYDRMLAEGDEDLAPPGYSRQQIGFKVILEKDGTLFDIVPEAVEVAARPSSAKGKGSKPPASPKPVAKRLLVMGQSKPSGSGINPCFLWDNPTYMLGLVPEGREPAWAAARYEAFRDRHLSLKEEIHDPHFDAVCEFLKSWKPAHAAKREGLADIATSFGVFSIRGPHGYVHERPKIKEWWEQHGSKADGDDDSAGDGPRTLVPALLDHGASQPVARLHEPKIKNIAGAQSSGATIVSFNQDAFASYGKDQGANAAIGEEDAFKYCTALNRLTSDDGRRVRLAGDTIVFWSEGAPKAEQAIQDFFGSPVRDQNAADRAREAFERARQGLPDDALGDPATPFYVLGLAPNMARIGVRLWLESNVGDILTKVATFQDQILINPPPFAPSSPTPLWRIAAATARTDNKGETDFETIDPALSAALLRSILTGTPFPQRMLAQVVARCAREGTISRDRAGCIKAILIRQGDTTMEPYVNGLHDDPAYHCGRQLAVLNVAQRLAIDSDSTLVRRNLGGVLASPANNLPRLAKAAEMAYYPKLEKDVAMFLRDRMRAICSMIGDETPISLNAARQGMLLLGMYHEEMWLEHGLPGKDKRKKYRTEQGDWVRSRGEEVLANCLAKRGVKYYYEIKARYVSDPEQPGSRRAFWPDFWIPGDRPSNAIYIEYMGLTGSETYDARQEEKKKSYAASGITEDGGREGRLIIIDRRTKDTPDEKEMMEIIVNAGL